MEYTDEELRRIGTKLAEQIPPPTAQNNSTNAWTPPLMYGHYCPCCGQWCVARYPQPYYPSPYPPQVWYGTGGTAR